MGRNFKNLKGKKFGMLTVIRDSGRRSGNNNVLWECVCDCGNTCLKRGEYIRHTKNPHCGCLTGRKSSLIGQVFVRLTVLESLNTNNSRYLCQCSCGNIIEATHSKLISGDTQSCGCILKERIKDSAIKSVYNDYKKRANRQNVLFDLSLDQVKTLIFQSCYYCGSLPEHNGHKITKTQALHYNGIDRLIPSEGYTIENCVSCCGFCNRAKFTYTVDKFKDWIQRLIDFNK